MQPLIVNKTKFSPSVTLDRNRNIFKISGISLPHDASEFYQQIIDWFTLYLKTPNTSTILVFELEYFNSASSKLFIKLFKQLNHALELGHNIEVEWCYMADDTDTLEAGMDYSSMIPLPFTFKELQFK